jgi:hypothetical protein
MHPVENLGRKALPYAIALLTLGGCSKKDSAPTPPKEYGQITLDAKSMYIGGDDSTDVSTIGIKFTNGQTVTLSNAHVSAGQAAASLAITDLSTDASTLSADPSENEYLFMDGTRTPANAVLTISDKALQAKLNASSIVIRSLPTQSVFASVQKVLQFTTAAQKTAHYPAGRAFIQGKNNTINSAGFAMQVE